MVVGDRTVGRQCDVKQGYLYRDSDGVHAMVAEEPPGQESEPP
jgi:hypothetical protein